MNAGTHLSRLRVIFSLSCTIGLLVGPFGCSKNNPVTMNKDHDVLPALVTIQARLGTDSLIPTTTESDLVEVLDKCNNPRLVLWWNQSIIFQPEQTNPGKLLFTKVETTLPLRIVASLYDLPSPDELASVPDHPESRYGEARFCLINDTDGDGIYNHDPGDVFATQEKKVTDSLFDVDALPIADIFLCQASPSTRSCVPPIGDPRRPQYDDAINRIYFHMDSIGRWYSSMYCEPTDNRDFFMGIANYTSLLYASDSIAASYLMKYLTIGSEKPLTDLKPGFTLVRARNVQFVMIKGLDTAQTVVRSWAGWWERAPEGETVWIHRSHYFPTELAQFNYGAFPGVLNPKARISGQIPENNLRKIPGGQTNQQLFKANGS